MIRRLGKSSGLVATRGDPTGESTDSSGQRSFSSSLSSKSASSSSAASTASSWWDIYPSHPGWQCTSTIWPLSRIASGQLPESRFKRSHHHKQIYYSQALINRWLLDTQREINCLQFGVLQMCGSADNPNFDVTLSNFYLCQYSYK